MEITRWREHFDKREAEIGAFIDTSGIDAFTASFKADSADNADKNEKPLAGLPFAVKDNIAVKGFSLSCGSLLLKDLRSAYTASAVSKLYAAGATVIGKTNMDEFGMGSSTDLSAIKKTNNPWDTSRVAGGSSGGSAAAVAAGQTPFALGSDTGGSVRQPAAFCGVIGLKPTWGAVSRYGLVAYASSLETIGVLAKNTALCRKVFEVMRGSDSLDMTSFAEDAAGKSGGTGERPGQAGQDAGKAKKVIGVLSPEAIAKAIASDASSAEAAAAASLSSEVERAFKRTQEALQDSGYKLLPVEMPTLKYGVPAYYTIATAEASANLARFDGVRYGKRPDWAENPDDLTAKSRTEGFGQEVKLRVLLGTFVLRSGFQDKFYHRAQKIRRAIKNNFEFYLGNAGTPARCEALLSPVFPTPAFGRGGSGLSSFAQKAADLYTSCANLAALPALAFPAAVEGGLPVGMQLIGAAFCEQALFNIVERFEKIMPPPHPPCWKEFF